MHRCSVKFYWFCKFNIEFVHLLVFTNKWQKFSMKYLRKIFFEVSATCLDHKVKNFHNRLVQLWIQFKVALRSLSAIIIKRSAPKPSGSKQVVNLIASKAFSVISLDVMWQRWGYLRRFCHGKKSLIQLTSKIKSQLQRSCLPQKHFNYSSVVLTHHENLLRALFLSLDAWDGFLRISWQTWVHTARPPNELFLL